MKKVLFFLLLLLVACAPAAPGREPTPAKLPEQPEVSTQEVVTSPAKELPPKTEVPEEEVTGTPVEPTGWEHDPYSQLGCEQLLTAREFAQACGKSEDSFVVTYRIGTKNCYVNVKDRANERLTAGVSLTGYTDAETAEKEFDRRLVVLKVGADKSVGERAYEMPNPPVDRVEAYFLRNEFLVQVGTDVRLCGEEGMYSFARIVDGRLK
jgi:hypothetical protein